MVDCLIGGVEAVAELVEAWSDGVLESRKAGSESGILNFEF
jgi:hypothetical protein